MFRSQREARRSHGTFPLSHLLLVGALLACAGVAHAEAPSRAAAGECTVSLPEIYNRVSPAVVRITSSAINPYNVANRVSRAIGSGVIIDPGGLVLTNAHVVFGRQAITATLDDGTTIPAEVIGSDPLFDIAVLRIPQPAAGTLPVAVAGSSGRLRVGEEVVAIGNPLGLDQTMTHGVVSAINRVLPEMSLVGMEPLIQTDAPINPGNSGGPLVNRCGEVVGLTAAFLSDAQNIGFAIPIDLVKGVLPALLTTGRIIRPWLGIQGQLVAPALKALLRVPLAPGFLVEVVEPGSPAEQAGIRGGQLDVIIGTQEFLLGGDIITRVNGQPVDTPERLTHVLHGWQVGDTLHLELARDGQPLELTLLLVERPILPQDIHPDGSMARTSRRP